MTRIILVRHGDTAMDGDRRYRGCRDVELNPSGMKQAERLRDRLAPEKMEISEKPVIFYSRGEV